MITLIDWNSDFIIKIRHNRLKQLENLRLNYI